MSIYEKVLGQLLFNPRGIDFEVKTLEDTGWDHTDETIIYVDVDDSKMIKTSKNYDSEYEKFINDYLEDKIYDTLKYVGKQDGYWTVKYRYPNKSYRKELQKEVEEIVSDYLLEKSRVDGEEYNYSVRVVHPNNQPFYHILINTDIPKLYYRELHNILSDEDKYDNTFIQINNSEN
jgi:hypothetical protein